MKTCLAPFPSISNIDDDLALQHFKDAYDEHLQENYPAAINLFKKSIQIKPTSEAYTGMAWSHALCKEFEAAIAACHEALILNPKFCNAMNDLGAYLIEIGQMDEAIDWLKKAIKSSDYVYPFYSYYNLGRIYREKEKLKKALSCFKKALELKPEFSAAQKSYDELLVLIN